MVNHEGKANRRFQRRVQVRIRCGTEARATNGAVSGLPPILTSAVPATIRNKIFLGALL